MDELDDMGLQSGMNSDTSIDQTTDLIHMCSELDLQTVQGLCLVIVSSSMVLIMGTN